MSRKPAVFVPAEAAINSTLVNAGPTQGVQAKLKVNPISNAVNGAKGVGPEGQQTV